MRRHAAPLVLALAVVLPLAGCATPGAGGGGPSAPEVTPALRATTEDSDASTYGLFLAGETALDMGSGSEAAGYLAQASRSDPQNAALRERAFTANLLAGRIDEAAGFAPGVVATVTPDAAASFGGLGRLTVGVSDLANGDARASVVALSPTADGAAHAAASAALLPWAQLASGRAPVLSAAAAKPGDLDAERAIALNRARIYERTGRMGEAERAFRLAVSRGGADMALAYGGFLERRGRRAEALKAYDAALSAAPGDPALSAARARAAAGGSAPTQPTLLQAAGEALIGPAADFARRRQPEVAVIYLRLSLRLDPGDAPAWVALGDALNAGGDAQDAVFAWRQVRPDQPDYPGAAGRLAVALQGTGDKAGALTLASAAARAAPDDTAVQVVYAELLRDADRNDDAVQVADRLVKALPPEAKGAVAAKLYFLRGSLLERAGRWTQAEPDLARAVALQPDDPEMLNYLGFALADRGERLPQALAMLEKAAAAAPQDGAIADSVGWARLKLGDAKGAVRDLERAVGLAPADPDINDHLGDAYARVGRRAEAAYQWRRVLALDPDAKLRAAVEAKLRAQGTATRA